MVSFQFTLSSSITLKSLLEFFLIMFLLHIWNFGKSKGKLSILEFLWNKKLKVFLVFKDSLSDMHHSFAFSVSPLRFLMKLFYLCVEELDLYSEKTWEDPKCWKHWNHLQRQELAKFQEWNLGVCHILHIFQFQCLAAICETAIKPF